MTTTFLKDVIKSLNQPNFDLSQAEALASCDRSFLVEQFGASFPVVFLERSIGQKRELGMAREIALAMVSWRVPGSRFQRQWLVPLLKHCLFMSHYCENLGGLTLVSSIRVEPSRNDALEVTLRTRRGWKLDKGPDGWSLKPVPSSKVTLSEALLEARGWKFERFGVFANPTKPI